MNIGRVVNNKREYLDLLLLADESEIMIDKYLVTGEMFVVDDYGIKAECVVTEESKGTYGLGSLTVFIFDTQLVLHTKSTRKNTFRTQNGHIL